MHPRRAFFHRITAVLAIVVVGAFVAESVIADVCDGDGAPSSISAHGMSPQTSAPPGPGQAPGHTMHVCHCVHAHGGIPAFVDRAADAGPLMAVRGASEAAPPSHSLERHLRPPIA